MHAKLRNQPPLPADHRPTAPPLRPAAAAALAAAAPVAATAFDPRLPRCPNASPLRRITDCVRSGTGSGTGGTLTEGFPHQHRVPPPLPPLRPRQRDLDPRPLLQLLLERLPSGAGLAAAAARAGVGVRVDRDDERAHHVQRRRAALVPPGGVGPAPEKLVHAAQPREPGREVQRGGLRGGGQRVDGLARVQEGLEDREPATPSGNMKRGESLESRRQERKNREWGGSDERGRLSSVSLQVVRACVRA